MKNNMLLWAWSFGLGFVLPMALLLLLCKPETQTAPPEETNTAESIPLETTPQKQMILVGMADGVEEMELETYLAGVLKAEMPLQFHSEALKAQTVVARTYALRKVQSGKHDGFDVCTDSRCCQGWKPVDDTEAAMLSELVAQTAGLVLRYDGSLIDATYFSCSGGTTEAAVAVWGSDVPYLQVTDSPGEENAAHYTDVVAFSASDFSDALDIDGSGNPEDWFGDAVRTDGGGIDRLEICGKTFSGTELRKKLGLRSTNFTWSVLGDSIILETHGFGHRVGMSQYGADAMARSGADFREILLHYYNGVTLEPYA